MRKFADIAITEIKTQSIKACRNRPEKLNTDVQNGSYGKAGCLESQEVGSLKLLLPVD
jgi:hypothetical protein